MNLQDRLANLSGPQREALLNLLEQQQGKARTFPLSVSQEGMWFLERLQPRNAAYWGVSALLVNATLDLDTLDEALASLAAQEELFRTSFKHADGKPVQVVAPEGAPILRRLTVDGEVDEESVAALAGELVGDPVPSLDDGVPLLVGAAPAGDATLLIFAAHHLLVDRQSAGLMVQRLSDAYQRLRMGQSVETRSDAIQYADFSVWQQEQRESTKWREQLAWWAEQLSEVDHVVELPTDHQRPAVSTLRGEQQELRIDADVMRALAEVGRAQSATTYMTLLAAFAVLVHRLTKQESFAIASPASMRNRSELEEVLGYFINVLPIPVRVQPEHTFEDVVANVRAACLGAYEHADVPFDLIVGELNVERDLSRPALCQLSVTYGPEPVTPDGFRAEMQRIPVPSLGARFDLELQAFHQDGELTGYLEYNSEIFDAASLARFADQLVRIVTAVAEDPTQSIGRLTLLAPHERETLISEFNDTQRDWPPSLGFVHECFEAQVRAHPDAPAVTFEDVTITYAEFNRQANQLARRLRERGVSANGHVGVLMERSLELIIALMAITKAGGAYVPLDPEYPINRVQDIVEDAECKLVLTLQRFMDVFGPLDTELWAIDEMAPELAEQPGDDLGVTVNGGDACYVIFTSGSTGKPKGVVNVHSGLRNRLLWMQEAFPLDLSDVVLQKTPFTFDVSVWEFYWAFMFGAHLVVAAPDGHRDPDYLSRMIRAHQVTTMHFVPSMLQLFMTQPIEELTSLRQVFCSGESLPADLRDRWLTRSEAALHNLYGPTEAAIDVTHWACGPEDPAGSTPIGRPIANTQIYVLDEFLEPTPIGVGGELYIGGANVARGYLNRPELTSEKFIPDPFSDVPGARLYRSGDVARYDVDGVIHFLGRLDHQIKLRGQRVELGEIEARICDVEGVREAVVVPWEVSAQDVRLVAYLTTESELDPGTVAAALREQLPSYMVPAHYEMLDALPLSRNGKVDRKQLPKPSLGHTIVAPYVAPENQLEEDIVALWNELLGVDDIGRDDNFFDRGGHSLLMVEMQQKLGEKGHDVSLVSLFQYPTVAMLAEHLSGGSAGTEVSKQSQRRAQQRQDASDRRRALAERRKNREKHR